MPKYKCRFSNNDSPLYSKTTCEAEANYFHYKSKKCYLDFIATLEQINKEVILSSISLNHNEDSHIYRFRDSDYPKVLKLLKNNKNVPDKRKSQSLIELVRSFLTGGDNGDYDLPDRFRTNRF